MEKTFSGICLVALLAVVGAQVAYESEHGSIRGYGVQDVYDYQATGWMTEKLKSATLNWKYSNTSITLNLTIDSSIVSNDMWYGIGLKDPSSGQGMQKGEFFVFKNLSNAHFQHMNTFSLKDKGGRPSNDSSSTPGPTISVGPKVLSNGDLNIVWSKELNTAVKDQTLNMTVGNKYTLLCAYGIMKNETIQDHGSNCSSTTIKLANDSSATAIYSVLLLSLLQLFF